MYQKLLTLVIFTLFPFLIQAQFVDGSHKDIEKLKKTKTLVVLSPTNDAFNTYMKDAVEKNWTITDYEFIPFQEVEKYQKNEKYSFLIVNDFNVSVGGGTQIYTSCSFYIPEELWNKIPGLTDADRLDKDHSLTLQFGGKDFNKIKNWLSFAYAGIHGVNLQSPKLEHLVKLIHNSILLVEKQKLKKLMWDQTGKVSNAEKPLNTKTLILFEEEIPQHSFWNRKTDTRFLDKEEVKKIFSGNFEILNLEELAEAVNSKNEDYLYFGSYVEGKASFVFLYDCNGGVVFFDKLPRKLTGYTSWWETVLKSLNKGV